MLKDGFLQQVDTPLNLYDRPDNVFVAAFIGSPSMNLYETSDPITHRHRFDLVVGDVHGCHTQLALQRCDLGAHLHA